VSVAIQPKRVYVATRYSDRALAQAFARKLEKCGHGIESRWHSGPKVKVPDRDLPVATADEIAEANIRHVGRADALVVLGHVQSIGAAIELGWAHAHGTRDIIFVGDWRDHSVMTRLKGVKFAASEDEALGLLK
jgi:hypothetical protein